MDRIFEAYNGDIGTEFMHKTRERLHWVCSQVWGSRVLDVGCSQGVVPIILARMGYAVDGLDINPEAIAFANEQLAKEPADIQSKVTYTVADFGKFVPPQDRTYDVITMTEVLEHLVRPQDFIRKAFSILPEKGRFIVTVPFGINDDPDHRQTFYLTSIYSLIHPLFEISGVKIFGGWIGFSCRRRAAETKDPPVIPLNLMRQAEEAFFKIERPLRDGTLAVRNQRQALKAEQEKLAEDLRAAEKARLEAEARVAAADTTPLRSELADMRGQLSASEGEKQTLQTSLEVERKASAGLQDQVSMLKAMLQFATSRQQDNSQETRLLEYSQEVRDLRTALDRKRDEIVERAEQIGRLNGRIEYFEEANKRLLAERDKFQSDCESGKARVIALESEREELRRTFEAETEQHRRADEAAQERLRSMEAELAEKARALSEVESKFADESKALQASQTEVGDLGDRVKTQEEQVREQAGRIKELEAELDRRRTWTEQHKRESKDIRMQLFAVQNELAEKKRALSDFESRLAAESKAHQESLAKIDELGQQLETNAARSAAQSEQDAAQTAQAEAQAARIKELEEALAAERNWTEQHKRECAAVQGRLAAAEKDLAAKSKSLVEAEKKSANEEKSHRKFSSEAYNLGKQVAVQAARIKTLEAELSGQTKKLQENVVALTKSAATCATERRAKQDAQAQVADLRRQVDTLKAQESRFLAESKKLNEEKSALAAQGAAAEKARATIAKEANASAKALVRLNAKLAKTKTKLAKMEKRFDALSKSKLGRLTLKYWKFKDALSGRNKAKPKYSEVVPAASPAMTLAERIRRLSNDNYSYSSVCRFLKSVKVACIMDEFTWKSYSPEANMIQLLPESYEKQLNAFLPDLIFIESAWRGKDDKWTNSVHRIPAELKGILSWAKSHKVPTAFWNKEDPIHFDTFKNVASLFDYIFTYDFNCVQRYKAITGKDNAFFLPMAVQPTMFNPIEKYKRKDAFCFAGSYYRRYVERTKDLDGYIKAFPAYKPVEIFDRQFGKNDPNYMMPTEYAPYIKGNLPYDQIDKAYKGYAFSINLNSIKQANSIARRVFELLACNTITVSNYSYGVVTGFGDLVITSDNADVLLGKIKAYAAKPYGLDKLKLLGVRKVFAENTYTDRFAYVCSKVFGVDLTQGKPKVALVASVDSASEYEQVKASFERQAYADKRLIVCSKCGDLGSDVCRNVNEVLSCLGDVDYVGALNAEDFYAEHYLEDLVYGFSYAGTEVVGKGAYFVCNRSGVSLRSKVKPYVQMSQVNLRRGLATRAAFCSSVSGKHGCVHLSDLVLKLKALSLDAFNYCEAGAAHHLSLEMTAEVSDIAGIDDGFSFSTMQKKAESLQPVQTDCNDAPFVSGAELFKYSVKSKCKNVEVELENGKMVLRPSLGKGKHVYFPIDKVFSIEDLPVADGKLLLNLETGYSSSVISRIAYFFLDAKKQKLGSALGATNSNLTVDIPAGTAFVRIQLRLQESGTLEVGNLNFAHKPTPLPCYFDKGEILCLANHYPSYDNIYRNGFVHTRLKLYEKHGIKLSAFTLTGVTQPQFSEFEGINVVSGNSDYLRFVLGLKAYRIIVVHFMDQKMWDVLKDVPRTTRILVWSHGSDIMMYTRRLFNYQTEKALQAAKDQSERRAEFWMKVLKNMPTNYTHVFVSNYLKEVTEKDLCLKIPNGKCAIIHNPVNTELFRYEKKDPNLRYKLISIRPFASRIYANDLTVGCVLELSKRSDFCKFEITIIGDGPLFDATLEPLRKFSNVKIIRTFLRQSEIHEYHRKNGIFIVPTRGDTQGVSRDEAMSSGLVPVTNNVAAIPEFVDDSCALLSPGEDYVDMAKQIGRIADNPKLFTEMSANAAARVRRQSASDVIVKKELALICR